MRHRVASGVITTYAQGLSGFGQITVGAAPGQAGNPAEILVPPALLRRAARYISGAADLAAKRRPGPRWDSRDGT